MVQMNLLAGQRRRCREQACGHSGAGGVGMNWENRIVMYMLYCSCYLVAKLCLTLLRPHVL